MEKIRAIGKRPGGKPYVTFVSNTLENLQKHVGGYIECVRFAEDVVLVCNEEGKLLGLPENFRFGDDMIVGDVLFLGVDGEEFCDCPADMKTMRRLFPQMWEAAE